MSEDTTVITPMLQRAAAKWKLWGPWLASALIASYSIAVTWGHRQADGEMQTKDFEALKIEVQQMRNDLTQVKESQARVEGTMSAIIPWAQGVAKFQVSVQKGAAEALATPVPKGPSNNRARK